MRGQLAIARRFARASVIGHVDRDVALWMPAQTSPTVHRTDNGGVPHWPDEEAGDAVAPPTIGWLLRHIEWWSTTTLDTVHDEPHTPPSEFRWRRGTGAISRLTTRWDAVLADDELARRVQWVMPEPQPLDVIAGWVNVELAKNQSFRPCSEGLR